MTRTRAADARVAADQHRGRPQTVAVRACCGGDLRHAHGNDPVMIGRELEVFRLHGINSNMSSTYSHAEHVMRTSGRGRSAQRRSSLSNVPVPARKIVTPPQAIDFDAIRDELQVPTDFPPGAVREAERSAARPPRPPRDATNLPFVTLDPVGSLDLDQAVHLERDGDGLPGALRDRRRRSVRRRRTARWPRRPGGAASPCTARTATPRCIRCELSEGAASLLPDGPRPAVLWTIRSTPTGEPTDVRGASAR